MDTQFKNIIQKAKTFALTNQEKDTMIQAVSSYMVATPLLIPRSSIISPYANFWSLRNKLLIPMVAAIILILGGGTAFAANNALPGDLLYPIKTGINENIKSFMAFGPDASAQVHSQIAENRLKEMETLEARGPVDIKTKEAITASFSKNANIVKSIEGTLKTNGDSDKADAIESNFNAAVNTHLNALHEVSTNDSTVTSSDKSDKVNTSTTTDENNTLDTTLHSTSSNQLEIKAGPVESLPPLSPSEPIDNSTNTGL